MTHRLLICDDSSMARKQMARSLPGGIAADILFATNGQEALEILRRGEAELMFLDLNMPGMDGYEVLAQVRREDLPVLTIVVSGDIQPEARERTRKLGAIEFIKKPIDTRHLEKILADYGLLAAAAEPADKAAGDKASGIAVTLEDYLQEIANVAMGRSSDLLARLLSAFVQQPVPRVARIANSELHMALSAADQQDTYSAVCQGFIGAGIAGEALLLFADTSFREMAEMLHYDITEGASVHVEVLMDMSSILFGAFLKGIGDQLDLPLGLGHPTVLGQHRQIGEMLDHHSNRQEQLLCIEINYALEGRNIQCDMLVLLTEDSTPFLQKHMKYLVD
ncbi:response regulator [Marinobacter sp.]|uniref:response regulator n=1 Tax=Marinobacter sp. TaxID=50741 RepID=UPI00198A4628|nr:response regulator [Marinobacter sp.]MBC7193005.1 response regulator [Marinobacter sp.]